MSNQPDYKAILRSARRTLHKSLKQYDKRHPEKRRRRGGAQREARELPNVRQPHLDPHMIRLIRRELKLEGTRGSFQFAFAPRREQPSLAFRRHPRALTIISQHERVASNTRGTPPVTPPWCQGYFGYFPSSTSSPSTNSLPSSLPSSYNHADATEDAPEPMVF